MNTLFKKTLLVAAAVMSSAMMMSGEANAQAAAKFKVDAEKAMFDDIESPQFSGVKSKNFRQKNWLEIETKLKVLMAPEPKSKTADKVTIKWYVAMKNPEKSGTMLLFTKDVEYVNIPLNEEVYCSIYLSPASIRRITGSDRAGKSSVEGVGFEVYVNGEKLAEQTTKWSVGWWSAASEKISRSDVVPLLIKPQTPFAAMWWDRYAEVNESTSR